MSLPTTMKAVGYRTPGPIDRADALLDIELPVPTARGSDLLVAVRAISANPVDTKVRNAAAPAEGASKVLGWDAVGEVVAVGPEVRRFAVGDAVYYAGSLVRDGANAQYHLVDERIVGHKPTTLSDAQAAALPLTAITAWEMLFDRLRVLDPVPGAAPVLLIVGGAGGVGSVATQLARERTSLTVITTASRPETQAWAREMGAHHVIDHRQPLAAQVAALGLGAPAYVFSTTQTQEHMAQIAELIAPQGRFGLIDDPVGFDALLFKRKSVSINWESMFTRSIFQTADMAEQGQLLDTVAKLVDAGQLRSTLTEHWQPINAANLKRAHTLLESGQSRGKIVLEGF